MRRILLNLLSNAYTFTPEGGAVTVQLSKRRKEGETEVEMQANIAEPLDIPEVLKTICGILAQRSSNRTGAKA